MFTGPALISPGAITMQADQRHRRFGPIRWLFLRVPHLHVQYWCECHHWKSWLRRGIPRMERRHANHALWLFLLIHSVVSFYLQGVMLLTLIYFFYVIKEMCDGVVGRCSSAGGRGKMCHNKEPQVGVHQHNNQQQYTRRYLFLPVCGVIYQVQICFLSCNVSKWLQLELVVNSFSRQASILPCGTYTTTDLDS